MSLISEPTAFTSNDPRELYNNILVFIVKDDQPKGANSDAEMHIFQCVRTSVSFYQIRFLLRHYLSRDRLSSVLLKSLFIL